MRLRTLSFILLTLVALVPCIVLSVVIYQKVYNLTENAVEEKLDRVAKQVNVDVIHQFELLATGLDLLSKTKLMRLGMDNLLFSRRLYIEINDFGKNNPLIESLYLVSEDGAVVESYAGDILALEDSDLVKFDQHNSSMMYSDKMAAAQFAASPWVVYFDDSELLAKENENGGIALIIPIYSSEKMDVIDIYGYLIATIPISNLIAMAESVKNHQELVNISVQGKFIDGEKILLDDDNVIKSRRIAVTGQGFKNTVLIDLNVAQSSKEIINDIHKELTPVLTTGAFILVVLLLIAITVAHFFSRAFNQLNHLIESFKLGGDINFKPFFILEFRDLNKLLQVLHRTINQHVQILSDKNNELAKVDKLREHYLLEVQSLNSGLEQQVELRTEELAITLGKVEHSHFVFQQLIKFRRDLESCNSNITIAATMLSSLKICIPDISIALFLPKQEKHRSVFQHVNMEFLDPFLINEKYLDDVNIDITGKKIVVKEEELYLSNFNVSSEQTGWLVIKDKVNSPETQSLITLFIAEINSYLMMRSLNESLDRAASTDSLTGVKNRKAFDLYYAELQTSRHPRAGLFVIDVNGLKLINDNQGHDQGDLLIINAANTLTRCAKNITENVYRIGGDEFAILLNGIELNQVDTLMANLMQQQLFARCDSSVVSFSFGYECTDNCRFDVLYKTADSNMYKDKAVFYGRRKGDRIS
ncbi:GGDEF domain-containing protein [Psychromonas marina]|uniref:diguanylate cyclase n=1 Tax=Psychromonas marina TaxID=88364 RepID=A0ABQ6E4Z7_9GAMM|nr:diguanylate cyclase [Psychromonas marina]GLS92071.1 GGDEF domain-containing protein [Psychromonas marina]